MANEQVNEEAQWYVMRAYKNERKAEECLSGNTYGLRFFIPKQRKLRTVNGRKVMCQVPVIHSLVFVYATHSQIVVFKKNCFNALQFVMCRRDDSQSYLTVPSRQMESFIAVCAQMDREVHFYRPCDIFDGNARFREGTRVRVHGGAFDSVEGYFMKVSGKRSRRLVVVIPDLLAATAEVEPDYLEVIG